MAAVQLNFTLRTSAKCKTVHLVGSWDVYKGQLPLSKDSNKAGGWKGTFRFQGATLKQGQRYWYYVCTAIFPHCQTAADLSQYVIDGYHVSHDPARESTTEPTTGRKLNILDIPSAKPSAPAPTSQSKSSRHARRTSSSEVAKGRSLSPSQIQSPHPSKPYATRTITSEQYNSRAMEQLSQRYAQQQISADSSSEEESEEESDSDDSDSEGNSDISSDVPSLSSRSSNTSSPSSVSTSSCCTCERYAITRAGNRVKLDCGGARCGYSDASSECSSESENEKSYRQQVTRRQGIVVRRN